MDSTDWGMVVTGGRIPPKGRINALCPRPRLVVAADSGLENAVALGISADYVVGDFDSLRRSELLDKFPEDRVISYPPEKDHTDTEIALGTLWDRGMPHTVLVGGGGGRMDHLLAILALFHREPAPTVWITHDTILRRLSGTHAVITTPGQTISLFPLGRGPCRMSSTGLKWPLEGLTWTQGAVGVSNVADGHEVTIDVHSGALLLVQALSPEGV